MTHTIRTITIMVLPTDEPLYSERATEVRIVDEAGGEYVEVAQEAVPGLGKIAIDPTEWPTLREAIDRMIGECRERTDADR